MATRFIRFVEQVICYLALRKRHDIAGDSIVENIGFQWTTRAQYLGKSSLMLWKTSQ